MAERTALARILVDDQDLSPLEVDNIRNFLAQFESDGEVKRSERDPERDQETI